MPVHRTWISESQLAELLGLEPARFVAVERRCGHAGRGEPSGWCVVTEGDMQTSGTMPQLGDNTSRRKPKKGKK